MSKPKFLLGFLAGAIGGTALGILMAPRKGTVTRSKLSKKAGKAADHLKQSIEEFVESAREKYVVALNGETKAVPPRLQKSKSRKKLPGKNHS